MKKSAIIFLSLLFILCSCGTAQQNIQAESTDVFAMDTYMNLKAYGENAADSLKTAAEKIYELEATLSVNNENSDIYRINHADGEETAVGTDTLNIINYALEIGNQTDGLLDISVYPVLKEWGFTTGDYKIPDSITLNSLLENVDYRKISVEGNNIALPKDFQIDTGALAKGYTGDEVMKIFRENGVESGIISLGGNVQALGTKPDGSLWNVAVRNPFQPDSDICIVSIDNKAVITSGNYERCFVGDDGKTYHHIIDTRDGKPAENGLVSVTIIGENGLMCDALSTALFISGYEKAVEFWAENGGFDMILVTDEGRIFYTDGIKDDFRNVCEMTAEVIHHD